MAAEVFATLLRELAYSCLAVEREGTASAGSTTTLTDNVELNGYPANTFQNRQLYIWQGTGIGQERRIVSNDAAGVITIAAGTALDATTKYLILRPAWTMRLIRNSFIMALRRRRKFYLWPKVDESIAMVNSGGVITYAYTVPAGFVTIRQIIKENTLATGDYWTPLPNDYWYINRAATRQIVFEKLANDNNGFIVDQLKLRIIGQAYETEPATDSASINSATGALVLLAAANVLNAMRAVDPENRSGYAATASIYWQEWLNARSDDEVTATPGSRWVDEG